MAAIRDVAILDLDRTLTIRPTFTSFLLFICKSHPVKYLKVPVLVIHLLSYVLKFIDRTVTKERMLKTIADGMPRTEIDALAKDFTAQRLATGLRPGAVAVIQDHRKKGHQVILATAAMDFIVRHFRDGLKLDDMIATISVWDENDCLVPRLEGGNNYQAEKAKRVQAWLARHKVGRVWFYSDSHVDLPTFNLADYKVAVSPTAKLQKLAQQEDFEIANWG